MSNHYFQFKQFKIEQEHCAMKVCTDSCLFGAWVTDYLQSQLKQPDKVLDIGAGTGLLSLMLAQKIAASIDAIELDGVAYEQAKENFAASPWKNRLYIFQQDVNGFYPHKKYDFIICNPPFYENDLKSEAEPKNQAIHATALNYQLLLKAISRLAAEEAAFAVLLPFARFEIFSRMAERESWHLQRQINIRQTVNHHFFRTVGIFSKEPQKSTTIQISIKDDNNEYTQGFSVLLRDYYLYL